jgi:triosephosphate isomerase
LTPIYCIGETLAQREEGRMLEVVLEQLAEGLAGLTVEQIASMAIAYEPVWAIGTGKTATPAQAQEAHAEIRKHLADRFGKDAADKCRIQYGGSVKPSNIDELMAQPDIDGALVGGASLSVSDFARIVLFKRAKALESAIK